MKSFVKYCQSRYVYVHVGQATVAHRACLLHCLPSYHQILPISQLFFVLFHWNLCLLLGGDPKLQMHILILGEVSSSFCTFITIVQIKVKLLYCTIYYVVNMGREEHLIMEQEGLTLPPQQSLLVSWFFFSDPYSLFEYYIF